MGLGAGVVKLMRERWPRAWKTGHYVSGEPGAVTSDTGPEATAPDSPPLMLKAVDLMGSVMAGPGPLVRTGAEWVARITSDALRFYRNGGKLWVGAFDRWEFTPLAKGEETQKRNASAEKHGAVEALSNSDADPAFHDGMLPHVRRPDLYNGEWSRMMRSRKMRGYAVRYLIDAILRPDRAPGVQPFTPPPGCTLMLHGAPRDVGGVPDPYVVWYVYSDPATGQRVVGTDDKMRNSIGEAEVACVFYALRCKHMDSVIESRDSDTIAIALLNTPERISNVMGTYTGRLFLQINSVAAAAAGDDTTANNGATEESNAQQQPQPQRLFVRVPSMTAGVPPDMIDINVLFNDIASDPDLVCLADPVVAVCSVLMLMDTDFISGYTPGVGNAALWKTFLQRPWRWQQLFKVISPPELQSHEPQPSEELDEARLLRPDVNELSFVKFTEDCYRTKYGDAVRSRKNPKGTDVAQVALTRVTLRDLVAHTARLVEKNRMMSIPRQRLIAAKLRWNLLYWMNMPRFAICGDLLSPLATSGGRSLYGWCLRDENRPLSMENVRTALEVALPPESAVRRWSIEDETCQRTEILRATRGARRLRTLYDEPEDPEEAVAEGKRIRTEE